MYGSMMNSLRATATPVAPVVGMGATILGWSDRYATTITEVHGNGKAITVQRDTATRTDGNGMSDSQAYTYAPDPAGERSVFTLRKNGQWVQRGTPMGNGTRLQVGTRAEYYDYSF